MALPRAKRVPPGWTWRHRPDGTWIGPPGWEQQRILFQREGGAWVAWVEGAPSVKVKAPTARVAVDTAIEKAGLGNEPVLIDSTE